MSDEADSYHVQAPILDAFIAEVQGTVAENPDSARVVRLLRPAFSRLLHDKSWLPGKFTQPAPAGGMGAGVGNYLIYRSAHRDLSLMSLVLATGAGTPIHDHLAWGLVGLYSGEQEERVYRRLDANGDEGSSDLVEVEQRHLQAGDFYELLPPAGDIHEVRTLGDQPSVSLHLLGNDIGCTWRHRFELHEHRVVPFRSGYSNEPCADEEVHVSRD